MKIFTYLIFFFTQKTLHSNSRLSETHDDQKMEAIYFQNLQGLTFKYMHCVNLVMSCKAIVVKTLPCIEMCIEHMYDYYFLFCHAVNTVYNLITMYALRLILVSYLYGITMGLFAYLLCSIVCVSCSQSLFP